MQESNPHSGGFTVSPSSGRVVKLHPDHVQDDVLWTAFRNGDDAALVTIFDLYARSLYKYGYKILSDNETVKDVIQDLFADLCQNRKRLGETNSIKFYLFKSVRRRLIALKIKRKALCTLRILDIEHLSQSHEFVIISQQSSEEQKQKISDTISNLTRKQQEAIYFRYHEDLSYTEISQVMRIRKQTVYNLINDALKDLRKNLKAK